MIQSIGGIKIAEGEMFQKQYAIDDNKDLDISRYSNFLFNKNLLNTGEAEPI